MELQRKAGYSEGTARVISHDAIMISSEVYDLNLG